MSTKVKFEFVPGCFDEFEGSQEELDNLVTEIKNYLSSDEFLEILEEKLSVDYDDDDDCEVDDAGLREFLSNASFGTRRTLH